MTVQSVTYTVQLDASNQPKPLTLAGAAVGFTTTRWIVISNLTPYVLELSGIRDQPESQAVLAPGTANKFPWSNQYGALVANWVNPISGAPPSTPQVIAEYSDDPTGKELIGSYPATLQSGVTIGTITGAVTVSGPVTVTGSVAVTSVAGSVTTTVSNNVTVTPSGTVNVQGVAGGTVIGIAGAVTVSSGTVNIGTVSGTVTIAGAVTATISGTPSVTISGTANVNISSGSVAITGNVTVQQIVQNVNVNAPVDALINTTHLFTTTAAFSTTVTPTTGFTEVEVLVSISSGSGPFSIVVKNLTNNLTKGCNVQLGVLGSADVTLGLPADPGDSVQLTITPLSAAGLPSNMSIFMVGEGASSAILTPPGVPISNFRVGGLLRAVASPNNSTVVILAAPTGGLAYALKSVMAQDAGSCNLLGTTSGRPYGFVSTTTGPPVDRLEGQLCIEGLSVFANRAVAVSLYYDLISQPLIQ